MTSIVTLLSLTSVLVHFISWHLFIFAIIESYHTCGLCRSINIWIYIVPDDVLMTYY